MFEGTPRHRSNPLSAVLNINNNYQKNNMIDIILILSQST